MKFSEMKPDRYFLFAIITAVIIFAIDLTIPLGVAFGVPYIIVILITLQSPYRHVIIIAVVMTTLLVLLGLALSPEGGEVWKVYFNRAIAIVAIWIVALLGLIKKQTEAALKESEENLSGIFNTLPESIMISRQTDGQILFVNPAFTKLTQYSEAEAIGNNVHELNLWARPEERDALIKKLEKEGEVNDFETRLHTKEGDSIPVSLSASQIIIEGVTCLMTMAYLITERKQAERLKVGQQQILELISKSNTSLDMVFENIINFTESQFTNVRATILYVNDKKLQIANASSMPTTYNKLIDGMDIGPSSGSCGTAAYRKERVIVVNVSSDPLWEDHSHLGAEYGFCSCWSEPIIDSNDEVIATFAIYRKEARVPGSHEIHLIETMSKLVGIAIERKQAEKALKKSEEKLSKIFNAMLDAISITRLKDGQYLYVNPGFERMANCTSAEILNNKTALNFWVDPSDRVKLINELKIKGKVSNFETKFRNCDGKIIPGSITSSMIEIDGEKCLVSLSSDITERKCAEAELHKLSRAVESSSSIVIITNLDGNIEYVNPKFTEVTGYSKEEVIGQSPRFLQSGEAPKRVYADMWKMILAGGVWKGELHNKKKDGSYYWGRVSISGITDNNEEITHYISIQEDVTHEHELSEQLSYQASHDALTGLINRSEFERRAEKLFSTIQQDKDEHALCFLDLDQFKVINETCGHTAGDELLRQLGQILQNEVRHCDTLARLGGDEFVVLMEHCSLDHAHRVADGILKATQNFIFTWEEHSFKVGGNIGLVPITESTVNLTELLKQADAACYVGKDLGRNRIHVYHPEDEEVTQRQGEMQWVTRIYRALDEDRFRLYAQSIESLHASNEKHYEILIRMEDEAGKIIPPVGFLPAAERYNLMSKVDRWVIENTLALLVAHPDFVSQIHFISINLSGQSLTEESFQDFVIKQLETTKIPPGKICFEITETAAITNMKTANLFITKMKELDCRFALDDFGSGLSSFAYLKNLPVDYLKIDGMFVKDIVVDRIDHAMVKSINEIGQVMGMETIAEFVENDEIKGMLREIGVNYAQGYGIGKPLPFNELLERSTNVTNLNNRDETVYKRC